MLVLGAFDLRDSAQIAADLLLQGPRTLAVKDRNRTHADHQGVIDEILHGVQRFGGAHAPHIDMVPEIEFAGRNIDRDHRTGRLRARRFAELAVRHHGQQFLVYRSKYLPEGDKLYEDDIYTDKSPRFLAAEIIREKAFRLLGDELPYGVAVMIDKWEETDDQARIFATLLVNRESHKGIVIGEKGAKLREISRLAREDISKMLGKNVYLEVWVRVRKGWGDDAQVLKSLGY